MQQEEAETQPGDARRAKSSLVSPFVGVKKFSTPQCGKCNSEFRFGQEITSPRYDAARRELEFQSDSVRFEIYLNAENVTEFMTAVGITS